MKQIEMSQTDKNDRKSQNLFKNFFLCELHLDPTEKDVITRERGPPAEIS